MACINGILLVLLGTFYIRKKINVLREKLTLILRYNSVVKDHRKILLYFFSFFYSFLNDSFLEYIFSVYYFKRISVFFLSSVILFYVTERRERYVNGRFPGVFV